MVTERVLEWIGSVSSAEWRWYVKILSGNDTLLTRAHQAGPYIPKRVIFELFPSIESSVGVNPRRTVHAIIDSHGNETEATAIWLVPCLKSRTIIAPVILLQKVECQPLAGASKRP